MTEDDFYKILVSPEQGSGEIDVLNSLSSSEFLSYHLRKPNWSAQQLEYYLNSLNEEWREKVVLHQHYNLLNNYKLKGIHLKEKDRRQSALHSNIISSSFHSIKDLESEVNSYHYVFLSPIFDSISKEGYKAAFDYHQLYQKISTIPLKVIALGGVSNDKIKHCKEMGFSGVAFIGSFWSHYKL